MRRFLQKGRSVEALASGRGFFIKGTSLSCVRCHISDTSSTSHAQSGRTGLSSHGNRSF